MTPNQRRRFVRAADIALQLVALLGLVAWFQATDPDCAYTTDVFLQLRMCDATWIEAPAAPSYGWLAAAIAMLLAGVRLR